ncbi:hypothetical protein F2Q70_00008695 [Brassica cretica]|uniref:Uncharacterized protein n=1 Tax=Brassica cretica TaxID=69181 RepID=A0A8S9LRW4_BRACR|nr:hypothetical protein F2Q70_00008695 [Brassica cretica]
MYKKYRGGEVAEEGTTEPTSHDLKTRRKTRRDGAKTDQPVMMNYILVAKEELGNGQRDISSLSSVAIEKWPLVK